MAFSTIVDEILQLLGEAKSVAPIKADTETSTSGPTEPSTATQTTPVDNKDNRSAEALKLKTSFQDRLVTDPTGAHESQKKRLQPLRTAFTNTYSGNPDLDRLNSIKNAFEALLKVYTEVVTEVTKAGELAKRVETLKTVAGATPEDQGTVTIAHGLAQAAVNAADTMDKISAAESLVNDLAKAHANAAGRVAIRQEQADRIATDAAEIKDLPEPEFNTFQAQRDAVKKWTDTKPLTDKALGEAETALVTLGKARDAAELAVKPVRQMRATFAIEAKALRKRVEDLARVLNTTKATNGRANGILTVITEAEASLLPTATQKQTEGFPEKQAEAKQMVIDVISLLLGNQKTDVGQASARYLMDELRMLEAEEDELPRLDDTAEQFAKRAAGWRLAARKKLESGGGAKASQARSDVENFGKEIAGWRKYVGPLGIVLGQRKTAAAEAIKPANPKDVLPAFGAALQSIRDKAKISLAKKLTEANVEEAERIVAPFPALLLKATQDAEAALRVAGAKKTLETDDALTKVIAAARPPAAIELTKARDAAMPRALLTSMDRDMPRTATLFEALVLRMQTVQGEGAFKDADKTPFAEIDESVRELAFNLCGPALVATMSPTAKTELSDALKTDGPAIRELVEQAFGGNPKVFEKMLTDCGAAGIATLARALAGDSAAGARKSLDGLIEKTGLGANPALLTKLIGEPPQGGDTVENAEAKRLRQQKNAAGLKALAENFVGDEGQAALNVLLDDCGLGHSPDVLASVVLEGGFDGDGKELRKFADAFAGDTEEAKADRAGFSRIIKTGGVGDHPKVLGPLAKQAGAPGVKQIGRAFTKPEDCANLKRLLDSGGMSGDTHLAGKQHEHPDTLTKVFVDGLGGDGTNMKRFAKAFSGAPAQVKGMLDAWNEYPEGKKDLRQPGKQIAKVMGRMTGPTEMQISKLQTQFTQNIHTGVSVAKRGAAYRFAPDLASEPAPTSLDEPDNLPNGYMLDSSNQGQSLCRRHVPKYFSRTTMNDDNTLWPVGTDADQLTEYLGEAIDATATEGKTMPGNDPVGTANRNKRTVDLGGGKKVEFAAQSYDGGPFKINHFHVASGWPQGADPEAAVNFPRADITAMCDAVEVF